MLDELEIIRAQRPDPSGPTETERAIAKERFMQSIADVEPDLSVAEDELEVRRARRRWPFVAAVAATAAATLVVVNGALNISTESGPLSPPPAAAAELHRLADLSASTVPPAEPYSLQTRTTGGVTTPTGTTGANLRPADFTTYVLGSGNFVTDEPSCGQGPGTSALPGSGAAIISIDMCGAGPLSEEDPALANAATTAEVHTLLDQHVDAYVSRHPGISRPEATLEVAAEGLRSAAGKPTARAELLRIVADSADIRVETNVTTQLGATGSRFSAHAGPDGSLDVTLDPTDGYLLEWHAVVPAAPGINSDEARRESLAVTTSYGRPQAVADVPVDVGRARDALVANTPKMESEPYTTTLPAGTPLCSGETFTDLDGTFFPKNIWPLHCWTTGS
jgi:hypothetical protein